MGGMKDIELQGGKGGSYIRFELFDRRDPDDDRMLVEVGSQCVSTRGWLPVTVVAEVLFRLLNEPEFAEEFLDYEEEYNEKLKNMIQLARKVF